MNLAQIDTTNRRQVRQFLDLPFRLYRDVPQWIPPLASDARRMLDRRRHPFYQHSEAAFFLALKDDRPVGRLAVLDNRRYNTFNREQTAFFYLFECEDDRKAAGALFDAAFDWARSRGMTKIIGPKGFTAFDGLGLLIKGFEHRPAFGLPYNPPYYVTLVEAAGLQSAGEMVSGYLSARTPLPDKIHQMAKLVQKRRGLRVAHFQSRRDLRAIVPRLQELYNASLEGTTGNVPLTDDEVKTLANQMLWFADPRLIKIIMKDDESPDGDLLPVGFLFAYPDISAAVQRCQGRLWPLGWLDCLLELRRTKWININGAGIIKKYRGLGGTALLFSEMSKSIVQGGFEHADLVQIGVENDKMQRELRDLGIDFYKTHRLYQRAL
jgi:GNAT superfamily N-acetyltransferase